MVPGQFKTTKQYFVTNSDFFLGTLPMNFYKDHAVSFLELKFIVFSTETSQPSASKISEHSS